jgi:hypothetical protein
MNPQQKFVLTYATLAMGTFVRLTSLNTGEIGIFISAYTIEYFVLKSILQARMRFKVDLLGLILLVLFFSYIALSAVAILE